MNTCNDKELMWQTAFKPTPLTT